MSNVDILSNVLFFIFFLYQTSIFLSRSIIQISITQTDVRVYKSVGRNRLWIRLVGSSEPRASCMSVCVMWEPSLLVNLRSGGPAVSASFYRFEVLPSHRNLKLFNRKYRLKRVSVKYFTSRQYALAIDSHTHVCVCVFV